MKIEVQVVPMYKNVPDWSELINYLYKINWVKIKMKKNQLLMVICNKKFSEKERSQILSYEGVQPIKINDNILRSETAVISALSIVSYLIN